MKMFLIEDKELELVKINVRVLFSQHYSVMVSHLGHFYVKGYPLLCVQSAGTLAELFLFLLGMEREK